MLDHPRHDQRRSLKLDGMADGEPAKKKRRGKPKSQGNRQRSAQAQKDRDSAQARSGN